GAADPAAIDVANPGCDFDCDSSLHDRDRDPVVVATVPAVVVAADFSAVPVHASVHHSSAGYLFASVADQLAAGRRDAVAQLDVVSPAADAAVANAVVGLAPDAAVPVAVAAAATVGRVPETVVADPGAAVPNAVIVPDFFFAGRR